MTGANQAPEADLPVPPASPRAWPGWLHLCGAQRLLSLADAQAALHTPRFASMYQQLFHEFPWLLPALAFLLGAIVGSFLNVVIYRIPAGRSIVRPGSTCACGQPVAWHDNIPILSWLLLRGRARCCGSKFSIRYPLIEALTGAIFCALVLHFPLPKAAVGAVFLSALVCAAFIDLDTFEIPDIFSVGLALAGIVFSFAIPHLHGHQDAPPLLAHLRSGLDGIQGMLIGSALVLWIALFAEAVLKREAMGFGDVKLVGAIGAFCGWTGCITSIFGGAIIGTAFIGCLALWQKMTGKPLRLRQVDPEKGEQELGLGAQVPYGPMLAMGAALHFLFLSPWVDSYFAELSGLL
ncbi:MAG: prepilin peptidase [Opitutaceae bacterium]|nr:prepilin peptidase [Opitutaceae bacterium]